MKTFKNIIRHESGFTLTELAVAMLVVGILSGIAIPSFLGPRNNSYDKEAQASVDAALVAAQQHYAQYGDYSDSQTNRCPTSTIFDNDLQKLEPTIDFVDANTASTGPRVVSVQAMPSYNSNGEDLGCQVFYAMALSRSGTCWIARTTVEGKYFWSGKQSPIIVKSDKNPANEAITELTGATVNGNAYAAFKPQNPGADAAVLATAELADVATNCKGIIQGEGVYTAMANYVLTSEYYDSWRSVIGAVAGAS